MTTEPQRLAITGTDTGVGKTIVACALAARVRARGFRVGAMKPLESGVDERDVADGVGLSDAEQLRRACGDVDALDQVRPYLLREPLAPMIAAQRAGVTIAVDVLDAARDALEHERQVLVVEGAGGLLEPIAPTLSYLDLFARWRCTLVIVAGNKLGVLNHVLLTLAAARHAGVPVAAVVLTALSPRAATVAEATNYDALRQLVPDVPVLRFPWVERPDDLAVLVAAAEVAGLDALVS